MPAREIKVAFHHVVLAGLVFGIAMGVVLFVTTGSGYYGFHGGFFSGAAFGWALAKMLKVSAPRPEAPALDPRAADCDDGEVVLMHGPANHFKGIEAVGGRLLLTNRRLRFRSHAFNIQKHDESYPLEAIRRVEPARSLGIIPNALLVSMADGRRERFVCIRRTEWVSRISGEVSRTRDAR